MDADLNCHQENSAPLRSGFQELCNNSVRFTHAFTTSTLTQPALTSVLTGLYPSEAGVRDNGSNFLAASFPTLAKLAKSRGYRTSLFSGGAPILRNSGLQQGFDLFEDSIPLQGRRFFRSAEESFKLFSSWAKSSTDPFFSVIYISDLNFINQPTNNEFGEARNLSIESQLEEIDFRIYQLIQDLKKSKRWDSTQILLIGLQGRANQDRTNEFEPLSIHAEQVRVAQLFKPAAKPRDQGLSWSYDANVSLADIYNTLCEFWALDPAKTDRKVGPLEHELPRISFAPILKGLKGLDDTPQISRWILSENQWGPWRNLGESKVALRNGQTLVVGGERIKTYSTLTDQFENSPLNLSLVDLNSNSDMQVALKAIQSQRIETTQPFLNSLTLRDFFENLRDGKTDGNFLSIGSELPSVRIGYAYARILIKKAQWAKLQELGRLFHVHDWEALGERNLGQHKVAFENPCLRVLDRERLTPVGARGISEADQRACADRRLTMLMGWFKEDQDPTLIKKLALIHVNEVSFARLQETQWNLYLPWNISEARGLQNFLWLEAMALPALQKLKAQMLTEKNQ